MFEKILFATTGSPTCDAAANVAFDLAEKYKSNLKVFHVYGYPTRGYSPYVFDVRTGAAENADKDYQSWVLEEMKNTYAKLIEKKKPVDIEARIGVPHTEILREARKFEADLIVMGAHTRDEDVGSSRFRGVVGSTMQQVARKARCPILIVSRPCQTCFWYFSNLVFATDFSKAADSAFMFAYKVAEEIGCRLHIFHAVDISTFQIGREEKQDWIEAQVKAAREKIESRYIRKMENFDNYSVDVWEGIPHVEILKFARERNGDLIIMAHHTREIDPDEALLGSTVEQVVLRAACPVASVNHPDKVAEAA
ncbi:MAG: universal stress protein [Desulfobacterales bacterium]